MPPALLAVLGTLSALLAVVDCVPYVRDVLRHATRPHRGTWLIWSVLGGIALVSQAADGATWSLAMVGAQTVTTSAIFLLAIRHGEGGLTRENVAMTVLAALGILGWFIADDPTVATACVVFADSIGVAMMLPKTWREPDSETLSTFALASAGGVLAALAVGAVVPSLLLYPLYYAIANGLIAAVIVTRRRQLAALADLMDDLASRAVREPGVG
jgi:hypothetical protein